MSYEEHLVFSTPEDEQVIWRYMDFTKFVSLIDTSRLFFCRVDKLGDPYEGTFSIGTQKWFSDAKSEIADENLQSSLLLAKNDKLLTYVNCWHMSDFESDAMWKIYTKNKEGIAIQSTVGRLISSLKHCSEKVIVGEVKYIDYNENDISPANSFEPFLHKRNCFEHEKELRAIVADWVKTNCISDSNKGKAVTVNLEELVEKIYISPLSEQWFEDMVKSVVSKYNCNAPVKKSNLAIPPLE